VPNGNDLTYSFPTTRNGGLESRYGSHAGDVARSDSDVTDGSVVSRRRSSLTIPRDQGGIPTATVARQTRSQRHDHVKGDNAPTACARAISELSREKERHEIKNAELEEFAPHF